MARKNKPYKTFDFLCDDEGSIIYNQKKWDLEDAISDYTYFGDRKADIIEDIYMRYLKVDEIEDDEILWDYKDGIPHFIECKENDKGAIKAWKISSGGKYEK